MCQLQKVLITLLALLASLECVMPCAAGISLMVTRCHGIVLRKCTISTSRTVCKLDSNSCSFVAGDAGASMLLTAIQAQTAIYNLRITRYISRSLMQQLVEQLASNAKAHLAKKKKSPRKKASK